MIKQYRVKINDRNFIVKAENQRQAVLKVKAVIRDIGSVIKGVSFSYKENIPSALNLNKIYDDTVYRLGNNTYLYIRILTTQNLMFHEDMWDYIERVYKGSESERYAITAYKDHNNNVIFESSNNSPFDAKLEQLCRKYYRNND